MLNNILVCVCATFSLSTHPLMDTLVASISWLLQIMLQCTWGFRYLFELVFSFPLDKHPEVDLMVVLFLTFFSNYRTVFRGFQFTFPSTVHEGSLFSISSPTLISCLFDNSHSNRCEVISVCEVWLGHIFYIHYSWSFTK